MPTSESLHMADPVHVGEPVTRERRRMSDRSAGRITILEWSLDSGVKQVDGCVGLRRRGRPADRAGGARDFLLQ